MVYFCFSLNQILNSRSLRGSFWNLVPFLRDILVLTYMFYSMLYLVKPFKNTHILRVPSYLYLWWSKLSFLIPLLVPSLMGVCWPCAFSALRASASREFLMLRIVEVFLQVSSTFLLLRSACFLSLRSGFQSCVVTGHLNSFPVP